MKMSKSLIQINKLTQNYQKQAILAHIVHPRNI